jgi:hypothetical protein
MSSRAALQKKRVSVIASIEGAQKIEFATLLENRAIGAIGDVIFNFLKPPC